MSRLSRHRVRTAGPTGRAAPAPDARLEQGFERSFVPVALVDLDGRFLRVNAALCAFLGRDASEVVGQRVLAFTHPDDVLVTHDATRQLSIGDRQHVQVEKRYVRPDGSVVWGLAASTLIELEAGSYRYVQIQDITDRKGAEQRLEELLEEHGALARVARAVATGAAPDAVYALVARESARLLRGDVGAVIRFEGDGQACALATHEEPGHTTVPAGTRYELDGRSAAAVVATTGRAVRLDGYDAGDRGLSGVLARNGHSSGVAAPIHVDGRLWGALAMATSRPSLLRPDAPERLSRFGELVGVAVGNASEREALVARASTDPLTGLLNHGAFHERVAEKLAQRAPDRPASLVLLDVDHFKEINDHDGHQVGDAVLARVAKLVAESGREGDVLARVGGDELAWLLPDTTPEEAWEAAERARQAVRAEELRTPSGGVLTISAGVCSTEQATAPAELFRLADGALYWAKCHGRNTTVCYRSEVVEALSAAERAHRLERSQALATIRALARAVDARDPNTQRHSERVGDLAAQLAVALGWSLEEAAKLRDAGLVHDVGKIGIPDAILLKPDRLTRDEYEQVKAHAALGAQIVNDILLPEQVAWVRHHHERWDGAGYPDAIAGEDIPVGARILAVADSWDVMTSERAYHVPRTLPEALEEVRRSTGGQFAPEVVAGLERLLDAGLGFGDVPVDRAA
jgi:diguanylate cyclase (GGDEF)-like protein/PAS domain S-box-containing protein